MSLFGTAEYGGSVAANSAMPPGVDATSVVDLPFAPSKPRVRKANVKSKLH